MRTEIDNFRAAALWALDSRADEDGDVALRIIGDLTAGNFEEWAGVFSWAELAVERAERATPGLRSAILGAASMSAWYRADYVRAKRLAHDALRHAADYVRANRLAHDAPRDAIPADCLSLELPYMALMLSSRPDRIRGILADGMAALDAVGADPLSRFRLHSAAAGSAAQTGDLEFAAAEANETLRIGRQLNHRFVIMVGLYLVALTSWRTAPDDALAALDECLGLGQSIQANWRGRALALAAQLRAGMGDADGAISALRQAITQCHRSGERTGVATAIDRGIQVLASTGHHEMSAFLGGIMTEGVFANIHGVPVHELPDRQRVVKRLEAELGADRYAAAIARGAAMSYDEALDSTTRALNALLQRHEPTA
jgi:tetratricopeptide (TPR) repeat protein